MLLKVTMRLRCSFNTLYLLMAILVLTFGLSLAEDKAPFSGKINADNINLRADATISALVLCNLNKGERVDVVSESYDWYKIRLPRNAPAYIKNTLVSCISYTDNQVITQGPKICTSAKVLKDRVNIRALPNESSPIIGIADKNEVINIVLEKIGWFKIEPIQNSFGWVHKKFIDKFIEPVQPEPPKQEAPQEIIAPKQIPEDNTVFIGRVMPYGIVLWRIATHKLITSDNKIFLLKGNRLSLNALNYQKVKVIGKIISPANKKYPVVEVEIIEVIN